MTTALYTVYPLDLTMSMASNHIENETKTFADTKERIFVPDGGPFYSQSLIIKDGAGRLLKPNVDYKLLYLNEEATLESSRDVVCVIWVLKDTIASVNLDYRVVGGQYSNTVNAIMQEIQKAGPIQKNVDWNTNVFNKPVQFPPAPHYHTPETFTGWSMVYSQLEGIRKAIIVGDDASWESHYNYLNRVVGNVKSEVNANLSNHPTFQEMNTAIAGINVSVDLSGYYNKTQIDATVREIKTTTDSLSNTFSNYYTKTLSDSRYAYKTDSYTKSESDGKYLVASALASFITETKADGKYALKTDLTPYVKTVTLTDEIGKLNLRIDSITGNIKPTDLSNYYTKQQTYSTSQLYTNVQSDQRYAYKSDSYVKQDSDTRYGAASTVNQHSQLIEELRQQVTAILAASQQYKVGDIFLSHNYFENSNKVNQHHGYGRWERYADNRALVGRMWKVHSQPQLMGDNGTYLTEGHIPPHEHPIYQIYSDTTHDNTRWGNDGEGIITKQEYDRWTTGKKTSSSGNYGMGISAITTVSPSIALDAWLRVPDDFPDILVPKVTMSNTKLGTFLTFNMRGTRVPTGTTYKWKLHVIPVGEAVAAFNRTVVITPSTAIERVTNDSTGRNYLEGFKLYDGPVLWKGENIAPFQSTDAFDTYIEIYNDKGFNMLKWIPNVILRP